MKNTWNCITKLVGTITIFFVIGLLILVSILDKDEVDEFDNVNRCPYKI